MVQKNSSQPNDCDAVLGGVTPTPVDAAVLGGLPGVKQLMKSDVTEEKITALKSALNYGKEGLRLVVQALKHRNHQVSMAAWELLHDRKEPLVQQMLEKYLDLRSEVDMVYFKLQDLLAAQDWSAADRQTRSILLRICEREDFWLRKQDIDQLPGIDLATIDRLWLYYSKGRFGFSVQKQIWKDCTAQAKHQAGAKNYQLFCDLVGWRIAENFAEWRERKLLIYRRDDIPWDLNAPVGHLPTVCALGGGESHDEPYTNDTESTMGFYSIDGYWSVWSSDSFFGPEMVKHFLDRIVNS